jgi:hypothetical protein
VSPPYVPEISDITDTSHFDESGLEGMPDVLNAPEPKRTQVFSGNHLPFVGFSYSRHIPVVLNDGLSASPDVSKKLAFLEREVQIAAAEKNRLELALQSRGHSLGSSGQTGITDGDKEK